MMRGRLRDAEQRVDLGQQRGERAARRAARRACATAAAPSARARAPARRARARASRARPRATMRAHQRLASPARRRSRSARRSARRAARAADPRRTPATRGAARRRARSRCAAVRIDQRPCVVARHRVDREVAPREVLLERHVRRGEELEAAIAAAVLALGARQRVFLARLRMQEHREVAADRPVAGREQHLRRARRRRPSRGRRRAAEQLVAHRAADAVDVRSGCGRRTRHRAFARGGPLAGLAAAVRAERVVARRARPRARATSARPLRATSARCRTPAGNGPSHTLSTLHRRAGCRGSSACRAGCSSTSACSFASAAAEPHDRTRRAASPRRRSARARAACRPSGRTGRSAGRSSRRRRARARSMRDVADVDRLEARVRARRARSPGKQRATASRTG